MDPLPLGSATSGRIAAIDYGTQRLGIAVTDPQQTLASPYANYTRRDSAQDARYLQQLVQQEQIVRFVVGLPVHLDGRESRLSQEARRFGDWLTAQTQRPVDYFDERFSSVEAEQQLRDAGMNSRQRQQRRDMLAAQILLTAYLEATATRPPSAPGALDDR